MSFCSDSFSAPHSMKIAILLTCTMDHGDPRYCSYLLTGVGYPAMATFRSHDHVAIRVCICTKIALEVCSCSQFRANGLTYFRMYYLYSFITGSVRFRLRPVITHLRTLYSDIVFNCAMVENCGIWDTHTAHLFPHFRLDYTAKRQNSQYKSVKMYIFYFSLYKRKSAAR